MDRELLERLCEEYNYKWDKIGNLIRIVSKRDEWYVLDLELDGHPITLLHSNSRGSASTHKQGRHRNLTNIFKAIHSHDFREDHRSNKLTRLTAIYQKIAMAS